AMVKRSSVNANTSAQSSVEGQKSFEKGKLIIGHITTSMKEINGTNKISEVLDSSFKVKTVELTMNESNERINSIIMQGKLKEEEGTKIANDCGDVLKQISVSAAEINEMVMSIATASGE
ncbi:MAG: methyl-accepting chemotaxis protein, partial [Thermoproteota archaeon]